MYGMKLQQWLKEWIQYSKSKTKKRTPSFFAVWVIFTRCLFLKLQQKLWKDKRCQISFWKDGEHKYSFNKQSIHISKIVNQGYNNSNISGEALKKLDREVLIILYNLIIVIIISIISRLVIVCSLNKMKVRDWLRGIV